MSDKPTGVFVRLPLSNEQLGKLLIPTRTFNERMISIGTPVTGGELRVSAFADYIPPSAIGVMAQIFEVSDRRTKSFNEPLVRQSDAQAQIAALEAEVVRLRESYAAIRWRFIQDARIEGRTLTERQFDSLVDNDDEAHKALKGGAA